MNKFVVGSLSFAAGLTIGFVAGQLIAIEKEKEDTKVFAEDIKVEKKPEVKTVETKIDPAEMESPRDDDPSQLVSAGPAKIAMPDHPGVNYSKVQQIVKENGYDDPEDIQAVIDDPENQETYEERVEREQEEMTEAMNEYRKKNKDKIVPIEKEQWDTDFPEVDYEKKDLYYFTMDNVLTDEEGNHLDINEYMGPKPGQFGWYSNDEERIYIRNNPKETDFQVWKEKCASEDWWA